MRRRRILRGDVIALVPEQMESERLVYERIGLEHAVELAPLLLDPRVARTLWPWPQPPTEEDVRAGLQAHAAHWERHGFGLWVLRDRASGETVGRGGLQYYDPVGVSEVEAGWTISAERWGHGLATELALASVEVAFGTLRLRDIIAFTLPDNIASRRVMEKAGFAYERDIEHEGLPHVLYRRRARAG